jgi:hypothetical protein
VLAFLVLVATIIYTAFYLSSREGEGGTKPPKSEEPVARVSYVEGGQFQRIDEVNDGNSFSLPFVGRVKGTVRVMPLELTLADKSKRLTQIRVFYDDRGNWTRLEHLREGAQVTPLPKEALEKEYRSVGEEITSVATDPPPLVPSKALERVSEQIDLSKASFFAISRVRMIQGSNARESSWLIAEVFGVRKAWDDLPEEELFYRVRLAFDLESDTIIEDDHL